MLFPQALTGTGGHTAGAKGVTALRVGHGLEGVCVVSDQGWAVELTDATMVEVEASLMGDKQRVVTELSSSSVPGATGEVPTPLHLSGEA